jgi:hypothetical protein
MAILAVHQNYTEPIPVRWLCIVPRDPIQQSTELLRHSGEAFWRRLRQCLGDKGLDPMDCVLAESHEDDERFEFGVVVAPGDRVFEYGFSYPNGDIEQGELTEWSDITERWRDTYHRDQVESALTLLKKGARP